VIVHHITDNNNFMNKILIILLSLFLSCVSSKKTIKDNNIKEDIMSLNFLYSYQTSVDSTKNGIIINYESLKLKEKRKEKKFSFLLNGEIILTGNRNKYHYLFEVFKDSFLVVSYVKGVSFAAGPDLFERNNVLILDLNTSVLNEVNLNNIYLTRSKEFLLKNYYHKDKPHKENKYSYCAIEKIDLSNNKITLFTESLELKEFITIDRIKPFQQIE